jgi:hypothetical protein
MEEVGRSPLDDGQAPIAPFRSWRGESDALDDPAGQVHEAHTGEERADVNRQDKVVPPVQLEQDLPPADLAWRRGSDLPDQALADQKTHHAGDGGAAEAGGVGQPRSRDGPSFADEIQDEPSVKMPEQASSFWEAVREEVPTRHADDPGMKPSVN